MLETLFVGFMVSIWAFAVVIGLNPVLGARIGLWLQGVSLEPVDEQHPPPPRAPSPPQPPGQEHLGNNVDRFV